MEAESGYTIVGEAEDGLTAVDLVERLQPDVLILDLRLPDLDGLEVIRRVRRRAAQTRIVMLSMHADEAAALEALRAGAAAYVLKSGSTSFLRLAVQEALAGRRYLSPPLSEQAIDVYLQQTTTTTPALDRYAMLTPREREILHLAAQSATNAEIGARLKISPRTVETHRGNLMRKLGLQTQTDLIRYALKRGLLPSAE